MNTVRLFNVNLLVVVTLTVIASTNMVHANPFAKTACDAVGRRLFHSLSPRHSIKQNGIGSLVAGGALLGIGYYLGQRDCELRGSYYNQAQTAIKEFVTVPQETSQHHFQQAEHHGKKAVYHLGRAIEKFFEVGQPE